MLFPFSAQSLPETSSKGQLIPRQHPCLAATSLHSRLMQCRYNGVAQSTRRTYQSGLNAYFSFCTRFNIITVPASSLTLQYFCVDKSHLVSYKTLKVYLAAICLWNGFPDPITDESLHLVCRGVRHQQSGSECTRLPITINLLRTLKFQLRSSNKSLLDQRLLWAAFTVLFYGFLRASECLSLTWSDVLIHDDHITITLQQSKTDPFRRGQSIKVYSSLTTTCPVKALTNYANSIAAKQPHHFVFSAGTFYPYPAPNLLQRCVNCCLRLVCPLLIMRPTVLGLGQQLWQQQLGYLHIWLKHLEDGTAMLTCHMFVAHKVSLPQPRSNYQQHQYHLALPGTLIYIRQCTIVVSVIM